jgi:glycosyltransferase involved in cell wall biosynthesis
MSHPLVSVIIPPYNRADIVVEAVRSALEQDYPAMEVVVVDDGSTDNTEGRLALFLKNREIIYVKQAENRGVAAARNLGLQHSHGDYVIFLDSDDLLLPGRIETHTAYLDSHRDTNFTYSDCWKDIGNMCVLHGTVEDAKEKHPLPLPSLLHVPLMTATFRRHVVDALGGFEETLRWSEDTDYMIRASTLFKAAHIPEAQTLWRCQRSSSRLSHERAHALHHSFLMLERNRRSLATLPRAVRRRVRNHHREMALYVAYESLLAGDVRMMRIAAKRWALLQPYNPKPYLYVAASFLGKAAVGMLHRFKQWCFGGEPFVKTGPHNP